MNRTLIAAALSLSSIVVPVAAHADPIRFAHREEVRAPAPVFARPVIARPIAIARPAVEHPIVVERPVYQRPIVVAQAPRVLVVHHEERGAHRGVPIHRLPTHRVRFEHGRR